MKRSLAILILLLPVCASAAGAPARTLVVCAPGSPGSTAEAQSVMDDFARTAERAAGLPSGSLGAVYFETEQGGLSRLGEPDAALALVTLPFFLEHGSALLLKPELQVVQSAGANETWSLVAKRGRVTSPASLDGWEITGIPGYSAGFVRGPVLSGWGALPASVKITATTRALSALRRAAAGENVAVLLDGAQTRGLPSLPNSADLEVVARSKPLPATLLCLVGARLGAPLAKPLLEALLHLDRTEEGRTVLSSLQMVRFQRADLVKVESARGAFSETRSAAR